VQDALVCRQRLRSAVRSTFNLSVLTQLVAVMACTTSRARDPAPPVRDYTFDVRGIVTTKGGSPVADAQVLVEMTQPVYEALTSLRRRELVTDDTGRFGLMLISHGVVEYQVTVRKAGFGTERISGASPPPGYHKFELVSTLPSPPQIR